MTRSFLIEAVTPHTRVLSLQSFASSEERTKADSLSYIAVPHGGFVLIYSDITERKRSQTETRAARDAAEAAYRDLKAAQASLIQAAMRRSVLLTMGLTHRTSASASNRNANSGQASRQ